MAERTGFSWNNRRREPSINDLTINSDTMGTRMCGDVGSTREKHCQLLKLTLLSILPGFILIIRNTISLIDNVKVLGDNNYVKDNIRFSTEIGDVIHCLQIERGTTALYVSSNGDPFVKPRLLALYYNTNAAVSKLTSWSPMDSPSYFKTRSTFSAEIERFRLDLDPLNITLQDVIKFYTNINGILIQRIGASINIRSAFGYWTDLVAYQMLLISKEQAGIERALGSTFFARGQFPLQELLWYKEMESLGSTYLAQSVLYSTLSRDLIDKLYTNSSLSHTLESMRNTISINKVTGASVVSGAVWFDNMTEYINILKTIQDRLGMQIIETATRQNQDLEEKLLVSAFELAIALVMAPVTVILIRNIIKKMQIFSAELKDKTHDLEQERMRTEGLLYQLLPKTVAGKLMDQGHAIPESYQSATIFFSDVVGFTEISSCSTPMQIINMLNKLYMTIDSRLEFFDVYKVETIGDGYMVASGLPNRNGQKHVTEIANLSLDLLENVQKMSIPHKENELFRLRIGFNTGPCVAGVVGIKMPRYCVFGDTVNTASRMESNGLPLKIHISESSAVLLKNIDTGFLVTARGDIDIKGKGLMRTYWLNGYAKPSNMDTGLKNGRKHSNTSTGSTALDQTVVLDESVVNDESPVEYDSKPIKFTENGCQVFLSNDSFALPFTENAHGNCLKKNNTKLIIVEEKNDVFDSTVHI